MPLIVALALLVAFALGIAWFLRTNPSTVARLARPILIILGALGVGGLLILADLVTVAIHLIRTLA